MSKLLRHLSPLAPDDSGACAVLYELGGITVICDAGGCAGNVCEFDEPRWHEKKSALFSAGLRDMDAILGRDKLLIDKLAKITKQVPAAFTAIVGTPVPAVIATDYQALKRMAEKATGLPCIVIPTDGTKYYDSGAEQAYYAVFDKFAESQYPTKKGKTAVLGATPLDTGMTHAKEVTNNIGIPDAVCIGLDSGLEEIRRISECERVIAAAPSAIKTAKMLQERFGLPYEIKAVVPDGTAEQFGNISGKKILIVHQQFAANELRDRLMQTVKSDENAPQIDCATWFYFDRKTAQENDFRIRSEADLQEAAQRYDIIAGDRMFRRAVRGFSGRWIDFAHYAVSGSAQW